MTRHINKKQETEAEKTERKTITKETVAYKLYKKGAKTTYS